MTRETLIFIHQVLANLTLRPAPDLEDSARRLMSAIREVEAAIEAAPIMELEVVDRLPDLDPERDVLP